MRITILVGSPRKGGNTELLAQAFAKGAEKNNQVTIISISEYNIMPCIGCNSCCHSAGNRCFQQDDMSVIYSRLLETDMLVIASPVYFYGISAQLKAVIDRLHTPMRDKFAIKKAALLLVGAAELPELFDAVLAQYDLAMKFFGLEDMGNVLVRGVREKGEIHGNKALNDAFDLGASIK